MKHPKSDFQVNFVKNYRNRLAKTNTIISVMNLGFLMNYEENRILVQIYFEKFSLENFKNSNFDFLENDWENSCIDNN